jgi:hypothetical protein
MSPLLHDIVEAGLGFSADVRRQAFLEHLPYLLDRAERETGVDAQPFSCP